MTCVVCHRQIEPEARYFTRAGEPRHMLCEEDRDAEPVDELDARSLGEGGRVRLVHHSAFGPMIEVYLGSESVGADLRFPVPAALALDAFQHPFAYAGGQS